MTLPHIQSRRVYVQFDSEPYRDKPTGKLIGSLSKRIASAPVIQVDEESFLMKVKDGHTFIQSIVDGNRDAQHFLYSWLICLDFDNKENDVGLIQKVLDNPFTSNAALWYETFSSGLVPRMRLVFFLDKPISNIDEFTRTYTWVARHYQAIDSSVSDPVKLIFGTNNPGGIIGGTLSISGLSMSKKPVFTQHKYPVKPVKQANTDDRINGIYVRSENIQAIIDHDAPKLKQLMLASDPEALSFTDEQRQIIGFDDRLDQINIATLLGLPYDQFFRDILSEDHTPSAHIIRLSPEGKRNESGRQVYKSFASNATHNKGMNALTLIKKIGSFETAGQALDFIGSVTGYDIETAYQIHTEHVILRNRRYVFGVEPTDHTLADDFPELVAQMKKANQWDFYRMLYTVAIDHITPEPMTGDRRDISFFFSYNQMKALMRLTGIRGTDDHSIRNKLYDLVSLGLIEKLSIDDMAPSIKKKVVTKQKKEAEKYNDPARNHTNMFKLVPLVGIDLDPLRRNFHDLMSREWAIRSNAIATSKGAETQRKIYPQEKPSDLDKQKLRNWKLLEKIIDRHKIMPLNDLTLEWQKQWNRSYKNRNRGQKKEITDTHLFPTKKVSPNAKQEVKELIMIYGKINLKCRTFTKSNKAQIERELGKSLDSSYSRMKVIYKCC